MNSKKIILMVTTISLFLMIALYGAFSDFTNDTNRVKNIQEVQFKLAQLTYIDEIVLQLQKERGLSAIYYEDNATRYKNALDAQRKKTDVVIDKASKHLNTSKIQKRHQQAIEIVNSHHVSRFEAFMNYTSLIKTLLNQSELLILKTKDSNIKNILFYYEHLNLMQETAGELRGLIGGILTSKSISKQEYNEIVILNRAFEENYARVKDNIQLVLVVKNANMQKSFQIIHKIIDINNIKDFSSVNINIAPLEWFKIASSSVNLIRKSIIEEICYVNDTVKCSKQKAKDIRNRHILFWSLSSLVIFIAIFISFLLAKKLLAEQKILENYKNVIDNNPNSIVSKTDKRGRITYINDNFCRISQYTREELIDQPHNIIRHKDVDSAIFKDLWKTIKSGKTWSGVVKNRAKDGTPYWVDASISPIYDNEGKLIEYIAMRHDITDMILQNEEVERTQRELIYRMGESVESRSKESGNHVRRVAHYSKILALLFGMSEEEAETLFIASTMHDMGKIAIPDEILLKPGKLDKEEFAIMKTHTEIGYKLLAGSNLPILKMASTIAYQHHEHFNGNGYPLGIRDKEISIYAKIVAIVDVFDALISDRVYKKAWELERVLSLLESEAGEQFDPTLVGLFLKNIDKFMEIKKQFEDV